MNRMGFNNDGAEVVARPRARQAGKTAPTGRRTTGKLRRLGGDPGQTAPTRRCSGSTSAAAVAGRRRGRGARRLRQERAAALAVRRLPRGQRQLAEHGPGLRNLQAVEKLQPLLEHVRRTADAATDHRVPLLVKIAPDLSDDDVLAVADLARAIGWTASSPPTPRSRAPTCAPAPRPSRRPAPAGSPAPPRTGRWRSCGCSAAGSATT